MPESAVQLGRGFSQLCLMFFSAVLPAFPTSPIHRAHPGCLSCSGHGPRPRFPSAHVESSTFLCCIHSILRVNPRPSGGSFCVFAPHPCFQGAALNTPAAPESSFRLCVGGIQTRDMRYTSVRAQRRLGARKKAAWTRTAPELSACAGPGMLVWRDIQLHEYIWEDVSNTATQ